MAINMFSVWDFYRIFFLNKPIMTFPLINLFLIIHLSAYFVSFSNLFHMKLNIYVWTLHILYPVGIVLYWWDMRSSRNCQCFDDTWSTKDSNFLRSYDSLLFNILIFFHLIFIVILLFAVLCQMLNMIITYTLWLGFAVLGYRYGCFCSFHNIWFSFVFSEKRIHIPPWSSLINAFSNDHERVLSGICIPLKCTWLNIVTNVIWSYLLLSLGECFAYIPYFLRIVADLENCFIVQLLIFKYSQTMMYLGYGDVGVFG